MSRNPRGGPLGRLLASFPRGLFPFPSNIPPKTYAIPIILRAPADTVAADEGRFTFAYDPSWLSDKARFAISRSLPLVDEAQTSPAAHWFFANLLPEGRVRALVARRLGVSEDNDFALLSALGGECAGALVVAAATPKPAKHAWRPLDDDELTRLSAGGAAFADAVAGGAVRLSLAGAQDKLPVKLQEGRLYLPLGASPSTHILKFASQDFKHISPRPAQAQSSSAAAPTPVANQKIARPPWPRSFRGNTGQPKEARYPLGIRRSW